MKITLPMYFFTATNLLNKEEIDTLKHKWEHCAFFIISGMILGVACAERDNVVKIVEDLQTYKAYENEELDLDTIQRY